MEMSEIAELPVTENENLEAEVAGTSNDKADPDERDGILDTEQLNETCKVAQEEDLMTKMIAKLKVLELQNIEYINEIENQKKVIEMLRCEVSKKR